MSRHLFLLRHGEALAETVDPERPLSPRGRRDVERVIAVAARSGVRVRRVCESGRLRARQTAEIAADGLGVDRVETVAGLGPNDPVEPWIDIVNGWDADAAIVGHMPFLADLAASLLAPGVAPFLAFAPASVACLVLEGGSWHLQWLLSPELVGESLQRLRGTNDAGPRRSPGRS